MIRLITGFIFGLVIGYGVGLDVGYNYRNTELEEEQYQKDLKFVEDAEEQLKNRFEEKTIPFVYDTVQIVPEEEILEPEEEIAQPEEDKYDNDDYGLVDINGTKQPNEFKQNTCYMYTSEGGLIMIARVGEGLELHLDHDSLHLIDNDERMVEEVTDKISEAYDIINSAHLIQEATCTDYLYQIIQNNS